MKFKNKESQQNEEYIKFKEEENSNKQMCTILKTLQTKLAPQEINKVLTPRELETLTLISDGLVKKEIAIRLNISFATVDTHIRHIYEKLDVKNAPSAVRKAFKLGLFTSHDDR